MKHNAKKLKEDPTYENEIKKKATEDVFKKFVEEEKLNLLPKALL